METSVETHNCIDFHWRPDVSEIISEPYQCRCQNPGYKKPNYVTGEDEYPRCCIMNLEGLCEGYKEGNQ